MYALRPKHPVIQWTQARSQVGGGGGGGGPLSADSTT